MNWHDIIKIRPELVKPDVKPKEGDWEEVLIDQEGSSGSDECCKLTMRKFNDEKAGKVYTPEAGSDDWNMDCDEFQEMLESMLHASTGRGSEAIHAWIQGLLDFWDECELNKGGSLASTDYTIKV